MNFVINKRQKRFAFLLDPCNLTKDTAKIGTRIDPAAGAQRDYSALPNPRAGRRGNILSGEARWYVVHTYSGYENKVAQNLEKAIENRRLSHLFESIKVPTEKTIEISSNGEKEVEHKLFPSYVMIKMVMSDESWHVVRNTRGVTGFVGPESKPVELTEEEIERMGVDIKVITLDFDVGDTVKINQGPFSGFTGYVEEVSPDKKKLKLTVSLFGRDTPVELETSHVEVI